MQIEQSLVTIQRVHDDAPHAALDAGNGDGGRDVAFELFDWRGLRGSGGGRGARLRAAAQDQGEKADGKRLTHPVPSLISRHRAL